MVEDVLHLLRIHRLNIEHSSLIVFKTAHTPDVLRDELWQVSSQDIPYETDGLKWPLHRQFKRNKLLRAVQ
jgi:hypothetical protein